MLLTTRKSPRCSLYLITPLLSAADGDAFAKVFSSVVEAATIACALVRLAPVTQADARTIVAPVLRAALAADCALLIENDGRLAARTRRRRRSCRRRWRGSCRGGRKPEAGTDRWRGIFCGRAMRR